jgi:hypothetical protein
MKPFVTPRSRHDVPQRPSRPAGPSFAFGAVLLFGQLAVLLLAHVLAVVQA